KRDAADTGVASILSKRDTGFTEGYDLRILNDNRIEIIWKNGSDQSLISNTSIPDDKWHHVAAIYDGTTVTIYIDGVEDNSANRTAPVTNNQHFYIAAAGKGSPTDHFRGNIDEVRVWDVGLSADQLRFIINQEIEDNASQVMGAVIPSTITKNEVNAIAWSDLKGYFPMSVFTYTNVDDASGNGNQGALRNLDTVDRQTAPLPYESSQNGNWDLSTTWTNGNVQFIPGSASIVDSNVTVDWNIVRTSHDVTIDNSALPAGNNGNRTLLGLYIDANELTVTGNTASNTGYGITVSHYMDLTGKLDLEGESQLIQITGSDLNVDTNGELERDQQGTADTYTYNYWAAPVGATDLGVNNYRFTVQDVMYDGVNPVNFSSTGYNGANSNPIQIADYWIWKYANLPSDTYSAWQHVRRTGTLNAGEGFTMKGPGSGPISADQNYVFLGKPNNADVNLTINAGNDYLVGNPYASAIDANQFILDNGPTIDGGTGGGEDPAISGTLYFWEHWGGGSHYLADYQGGYATYSLAGGTPAAAYGTNDPDVGTGGTPTKIPGRYIPVSQGFFVTAEANGTINFNNGQRLFQKEDATSVFVRSAETNIYAQEELLDDRPKIRIGFNSVNTFRRQLLLTIDPITSVDVDWGHDAKLNESQKDDMYWMINGDEYVIQASDFLDSGAIYPLGIKTENDGINTITLDHVFNVDNNIKIYVHDKLLDTYTNLLTEDYEIFLNAGEYNDRFEIIFARTGNYTLLDTDENSIEQIDIMYSNDLEKIILINPNGIQIENIVLYNMLGQAIQTINTVSENGYSEYEVNNLSTGTYIIKLNTASGSVSKKVIAK
ncbi:MAG: T9SS type A sorting domain-containing protein, partial [Winogradskyella sp.]|nr:T9SS type A sorting domain-containing protein [Winogradskyella sp.]